MDCLPISIGSQRKRSRRSVPPERTRFVAILVAACALACAGYGFAQHLDLLEPERAFSLSARPIDPSTIEVRFTIANGYYLYRDKLKFSIEPGKLAAPPVLPPGKVKEDPFFGSVETYRGDVVTRLVLAAAAPGAKVTLQAESQGCADAGVCYPPQLQKLALALPVAGAGPGATVEFAPARKSWFK